MGIFDFFLVPWFQTHLDDTQVHVRYSSSLFSFAFHEKQSQTRKQKDSFTGLVDCQDDQDFKGFVACINQQKWVQTQQSFKRAWMSKIAYKLPQLLGKKKWKWIAIYMHAYLHRHTKANMLLYLKIPCGLLQVICIIKQQNKWQEIILNFFYQKPREAKRLSSSTRVIWEYV